MWVYRQLLRERSPKFIPKITKQQGLERRASPYSYTTLDDVLAGREGYIEQAVTRSLSTDARSTSIWTCFLKRHRTMADRGSCRSRWLGNDATTFSSAATNVAACLSRGPGPCSCRLPVRSAAPRRRRRLERRRAWHPASASLKKPGRGRYLDDWKAWLDTLVYQPVLPHELIKINIKINLSHTPFIY